MDLIKIVDSEEAISVKVSDSYYAPRKVDFLTGEITKTLAISGGDFATIDSIFSWVNSTIMADVDLTIVVGVGTFQIKNTTGYTAYKLNSSKLASIQFVGSDKTLCKFEFNNSSAGKGFLRTVGTAVGFDEITFQTTANNYFLVDAKNSVLDLRNLTVNDAKHLFTASFCSVTLESATVNFLDVGCYATESTAVFVDGGVSFIGAGVITSSYGFYLTDNAFMITNGAFVVQYAATGIHVSGSSRVVMDSYSFSNNTQNFNVALNLQQGDGSYITDGNLANTSQDVFAYVDVASFPVTGSDSILYIDQSNNDLYIWNTNQYINVTPAVAIADVTGLQAKINNYDAHISDGDIHWDLTKEVDAGSFS